MTEPRDELLERYAEAVAQDPRRPSERVRHAARAHAQMLRDQAVQAQGAQVPAASPSAANQSHWKRSLVASLAVVGLAGLLYVQIDRGAPQDREIALGAPTPGPAPAPVAVPQPAESPAAAAPTRQPPPTKLAAAPPAPTTHKALPTGHPAAPAEADLPATASGRAAEQVASADVERDARSENRAESVARAAPAAAAAPPPPPATDGQRRARGLSAGTTTPQLLEAARTGDVASLHALVAQGAALNARDAAGNTALMLAARHRQGAAVRKLLDMGADTALRNHAGQTALHIAEQTGAADIVELLQTAR